MKPKFLLVVPFTGLGLYGGFRGNRWLRNRIKIFKQFVIPSLLNQSDRDFALWVAWRREERTNPYVRELETWLKENTDLVFKFTYSGIPLYDDKYEDAEARNRLADCLHGSLGELLDLVPDCNEVYWLLQPSDDCYHRDTVKSIRAVFESQDVEAVAFKRGYMCNYKTKEVVEYNPKTTPPFAAIRFNRVVFFDPAQHLRFISLKEPAGKYSIGTPLPSHEYLPNVFRTGLFEERGFMVGTHEENISTHFNHPYGGDRVDPSILVDFGIDKVEKLKVPFSMRKWIMRHLPHQWRRKIRFWFGEVLGNRLYNWLRN